MSYAMLDLVRERANEKDWELIFDSGPNGDRRTFVWEHPYPDEAGRLLELEITFNVDGRIICSEKRRAGERCQGTGPTNGFVSTEFYLETLMLI